MKRDADLVRAILMELERKPDMAPQPLTIEGYSTEQITYHSLLLAEAGLIAADDVGGPGETDVWARRLTWSGHEFLDAARNDRNWSQAKSALEKAGGFVFDVAKQLLVAYLKESVLLH